MEQRVIVVTVVTVVLPREKQSKFISQATTNKAKSPQESAGVTLPHPHPHPPPQPDPHSHPDPKTPRDVSKYMHREVVVAMVAHKRRQNRTSCARKQPAEITKVNPQRQEAIKTLEKRMLSMAPPPWHENPTSSNPVMLGARNRNRNRNQKPSRRLLKNCKLN